MLVDRAPHNMTANNAPSPFVASASSYYVPEQCLPFKAFDGIINSLNLMWASDGSPFPQWISLDVGAGNQFKLANYSIRSRVAYLGSQSLKAWKIQGSNDNSLWTDLGEVSNEPVWGDYEKRTFSATTDVAFRYHRILISASQSSSYVAIVEIELFEEVVIGSRLRQIITGAV